ncbi:helix-turn-helix domain-containing protein, partial [Micromonospora sp. NPDC047548]|uniref:helix-turn-helix domain-containing protein n=1 Tax=Micromonospora sp. NPDC047548 TaxID=3155624 RepID=UPI0033F19424
MALKRHRLAQRRKTVGHTQESLAEKLGVDRTTIVRWERAESAPQPWVRLGLAEALQVTPDQLDELLNDLGKTDGPQPPTPSAGHGGNATVSFVSEATDASGRWKILVGGQLSPCSRTAEILLGGQVISV